MTLLNDALRAGHAVGAATAAGTVRPQTVLVVGGGGTLGSAVLERLLGSRRFAHVKVLATRGVTVAVHGLEPVVVDDFEPPVTAPRRALADTALIVFDRERHANGRDQAFVRPPPERLAQVATWLHAHDVRRLVVVLPHAPASLPAALRAGLAGLDEAATAALGFEHLVFVRSAQALGGRHAGAWLQRLADGVLAQLRMMVAASLQPVRAIKVAQFVAELTAWLPASAPGTRVAPPELVWQAAQATDPAALVRAWLEGRALPPIHAPRRRL